MSSINNNFLINLINTGNIDLSNMQNLVDDTKGELFNLDSSTISSDSFISTSGSATFNNSASPQISSTTADATQYEKEIKELDEKIQQYEKLIEQYTKELEALEAELEATEQKIKTSENELESLKAQQSAKEDEYARVKTTLSQAENTNKDGSNDAFITNLNSQLQNISAELFVIQSNIFTKTSQIAAYQLQATTIEDSIASVEEKLSNTETLKTTAELERTTAQNNLDKTNTTQNSNTSITSSTTQAANTSNALGNTQSASNEISTKPATNSSTSSSIQAGSASNVELKNDFLELLLTGVAGNNITDGKSLMAQISEEEKELVRANNIDLTETYPDGKPKYVIAQVGFKYHIYQMEEHGLTSSGASLARIYCPNGGRDIVESGEGVIRLGDNQNAYSRTTKVYNLTCVSDDLSTCKFESDCKTYYTASPLSFDLNGDGVKTSDELIRYDIDGDGDLDTINDSADAVLVFDADGDGISGEDGSECFGDNTDLDGDGVADGYKDGFEALKALANKEGLVNGIDDNTLDENDLKILEEKYGLKIKTDGYNSDGKSLFDAGITEINLSTTDETTLNKNFDGQHNDLMTQEGATFVVNGEEREYADIWHAKKDE